MTNLIDSVKRRTPQELPIVVEILPAAWLKHKGMLRDALTPYEDICGVMPYTTDISMPHRYEEGFYTDEWGCLWENRTRGHDGICVAGPSEYINDPEYIMPPNEMRPFYHGFMFQRILHLFGYENAMIMMAEGGKKLHRVLDTVLEYNLRRIDAGLYTEKNGICYFGDDLGTQKGLPISPQTWRNYLKPCYMKIFEPLKQAGKTVFLHSDGLYTEIIPDLIDCGVDILNVQGGIQGLPKLRQFQMEYGLTIDYGINRQTLPRISPIQLNEELYWVFNVLYHKEGGIWFRAEIAEDVPLSTVMALMEILRDFKSIHAEYLKGL